MNQSNMFTWILLIGSFGLLQISEIVAATNDHPLIVTAVPYVQDVYYFNKGAQLVFKVTAKLNATMDDGSKATDLKLTISSIWLDIAGGAKMDFSGMTQSNGNLIFENSELGFSSTLNGNVSCIVKDDINPLSSLYVQINATAVHNSKNIVVVEKSTPVVYAVFPEVNVTRDHFNDVNIYDSLHFEMKISLPLLNASLYAEITTNVENFIFMEITNVSTKFDNKLISSKPGSPIKTSTQRNQEIDRVVIDFGNVTVSDTLPEEERIITIGFDIKVNDDPQVENGKPYEFGLGLLAGPDILWVQHQTINVTKVQPALNLTASTGITQFQRMYIGDEFKLTYKIAHSNTSTADAKYVQLKIIFNDLEAKGVVYEKLNDTTIAIGGKNSKDIVTIKDVFTTTDGTIEGSIDMKVSDSVYPLSEISIRLVVIYQNNKDILKRPVIFNVPPLLVASPLMSLTVFGGSELVEAGMLKTYQLTITLTKLKANLQIEVVLPKFDDFPIMFFKSCELIKVGGNINGVNKNAVPQFYSTTTRTDMYDQLIFDLGTAQNDVDTLDKAPINEIVVQFKAIANEHDNITTNGSTVSIATGVVAKPKMVWINQLELTTHVSKDAKPTLDLEFKIIDEREDVFSLSVVLKHSLVNSRQYAKDISLDFYLPPFVVFDSVLNMSDTFKKTGAGPLFKRDGIYEFSNDPIYIVFQLRIDRSKSPNTGTFNFTMATKLDYSNQHGDTYEYLRAVRRTLKVLPRYMLIPLVDASRRNSDYYSRMMYWDSDKKEIHVCMNQHMMSYQVACYFSRDKGQNWIAHDRKLGSILGRDGNGNLHGVDRNQITYLRYEPEFMEYVAIAKTPAINKDNIKDLTDASHIELMTDTVIDSKHKIEITGGEFAGAGDGLYYRAAKTDPWDERALWWYPKD